MSLSLCHLQERSYMGHVCCQTKKGTSPWMKLAPEAPKESGITCIYWPLFFASEPIQQPAMFFCIIEAGSSMTPTNRDLCHGEKDKLPMILFSTCFERWAPQETRQNEGSSHAILGKKWSYHFFFGPQTMVGLVASSIESTSNGMALPNICSQKCGWQTGPCSAECISFELSGVKRKLPLCVV